MRVSVCLGAILIPEYLDFYSQEQNSRNIFRNKFLYRNIPNERVLNISSLTSMKKPKNPSPQVILANLQIN